MAVRGWHGRCSGWRGRRRQGRGRGRKQRWQGCRGRLRQGCGGTCRQKERREPAGVQGSAFGPTVARRQQTEPRMGGGGRAALRRARGVQGQRRPAQSGGPPTASAAPRAGLWAAGSGGQRRPSRRAGELLESNLRRGHGLVAIADRRGCRLARYRDERVHHLAPYLVKEHAATHVFVEDGRDLSEQRGLTRCGLWAEVLAAHARRRRELPEAHRGADDEAEGADEEEARHRVNLARCRGGRVLAKVSFLRRTGASNGHGASDDARQTCARQHGATRTIV